MHRSRNKIIGLHTFFRLWYVLACLLILLVSWRVVNDEDVSEKIVIKEASLGDGSPASLRTYYLIEKYITKYDIPRHIAYNVAYRETTFRGPFDWTYNPHRKSATGAVGVMQISAIAAKQIHGRTISLNDLKYDSDLNIETSLATLRYLHDRFKSWPIACGYYNTGKPIVNDYAVYCTTNKNYEDKWLYFKKF